MNVGQICRKALLDANVVKQDGTSPALLTDADLIRWANEGKDRIEKVLRNAEEDHLWVTRRSDDPDFDYENETYDPSDFGLDGNPETRQYTLPPDLLELRELRVVRTSATPEIRFVHADLSTNIFQEHFISANPQRLVIYWDIVDGRTLYLANPPSAAQTMEISYIRRTPSLAYYNTGTIDTTQGNAAVTGNSTEWLIEDLDNKGLMELMVADSGGVGLSIGGATSPFVDVELPGYPVENFVSDVSLTLKTNWRRASVATRGYALASVPKIAAEHHYYISDYVKFRIQQRLGALKSAAATQAELQSKVAEIRSDIQEIQSVDHVYVDDMEWY